MSKYIRTEMLMEKTVNRNHAWLAITNAEGKNLKEIVEELPSADVIPIIFIESEMTKLTELGELEESMALLKLLKSWRSSNE